MARPAGLDAARAYEELLQRAKTDPAILAFWLGGSRGMGRATAWSDYDVGMIVAEDAYDAFCAEIGLGSGFKANWPPGRRPLGANLPDVRGLRRLGFG